jgi:hypothetical protein
MDKAVPSLHNMPMFVKASLGERLTMIAVDPGVAGMNDPNSAGGISAQNHYDVLFVGTTRGRVLKIVNSARDPFTNEPQPILVESIQVKKPIKKIENIKKKTFRSFHIMSR